MHTELRDALRSALRNPVTSVVIVLVLAVGIGASTAVFSLLEADLLRPLPYGQPGRIVEVSLQVAGHALPIVSVGDYLAWRRSAGRALGEIAAYEPFRSFFLANIGGQSTRISVLGVAPTFFRTLGVRPALGRAFLNTGTAQDDAGDLLISDQFWATHFHSSRAALGATVALGGRAFTVVGVLPANFRFWPASDAWIVSDYDHSPLANNHDAEVLAVIGRLRAGSSLGAAQAAMAAVEARVAARYDATGFVRGIALVPLREAWSKGAKNLLLLLQLAAGLVLLIACANAASLLLARHASRRAELAVRAALGADGGRLARQALIECFLLALAAMGLGAWLAYFASGLLASAVPGLGQGPFRPTLDLRLLLFGAGLTILTTLVFGAAPAASAARVRPAETLREASAGAPAGRAAARTHGALVIVEIALAYALLVGMFLSATSLYKLDRVSLGFVPEHVALIQIGPSPDRYATAPRVAELFSELRQRLGALPGVTAVAAGSDVPVLPAPHVVYTLPGAPDMSPDEMPGAYFHAVSPGYFSALGIRLMRGRPFRRSDDADSQPVVIINDWIARNYWPRQDPIGRSLWIDRGLPNMADPAPRVIIGIVNDVMQAGPADPGPDPALYVPVAQVPNLLMTTLLRLLPPYVIVRTSGPTLQLADSARRSITATDASVPVERVASLVSVLGGALGPARLSTGLLIGFGAVGLGLAATGVYVLLAYAVARRRFEIGVRLALGARPSAVAATVVYRGLLLAGAGAALGVAGAALLAHLMASLLYGVQPWDPWAFTIAPVVLTAVALAASYWPARRASRTSPADVLRAP